MYKLHTHTVHIPQLKRDRIVRVLLPRDYDDSTKRYPVLYMHDGQNLFDPSTAYASDWKIPSTLHKQPLKRQCIIVGIDNGGIDRMNEYAPYKRGKNGGEGDKYLQFIIETLKPLVENTYRTLPEKENTGIAGSSMGGLISFYAGLKYDSVFGKVGVLSPSIWFNPKVMDLVNTSNLSSQFYIAGSKNEMKGMDTTLHNIYWAFKKRNISDEQLRVVVRDKGKHNEIMWSREFKDMFEWFFL